MNRDAAHALLLALFCLALVVLLPACSESDEELITRLYDESRTGELTPEELELALASDDPQVRAAAADLVRRAEPDVARAAMLRLAQDQAPEVRATVASGLEAFLEDEEVLAALDTLSRDEVPLVRKRAVLSLSKLKDERALPALLGALRDPDAAIRQDAVQALAELAAPESREALLSALGDGDIQVRAWAARALGQIGGAGVRDALRAMAESTNPYEKGAATNALAELDAAASE